MHASMVTSLILLDYMSDLRMSKLKSVHLAAVSFQILIYSAHYYRECKRILPKAFQMNEFITSKNQSNDSNNVRLFEETVLFNKTLVNQYDNQCAIDC